MTDRIGVGVLRLQVSAAERYVREAAALLGEDPSPDEVAEAVSLVESMPCWGDER